MNLKTILYTVIFIFSNATYLIAQGEEKALTDIKLKELKGLAKNSLRLGDTYTALYYYEEWAKRKPKNNDLNFQVAELFKFTRNYKQAEVWYAKLDSIDPKAYPLAVFELARMQVAQGKYEAAKENYLAFKKLARYVDDIYYRDQYKKGIASCDFAITYKDSAPTAIINHLNRTINKPHVEFSPIIVDENNLIYGSLNIEGVEYYNISAHDSMTVPLRKFYTAKKINDEWESQGELKGPFNQENAHVGNATLSPDGNRMYYTICQKNWQNKVVCHLYYTEKTGENWTAPVKMNESINLPNFTTTQPAIGIDSRTNAELIYFVSDRPGGKGGLDLWYTEYNKRREIFKTPKNAGSRINSKGDEATPFYDYTAHSLYYSSNGGIGFGGYDIYKTFGEKRKWEPSENLGKGINSSYDDLDFVLNKDKSGGFIISNRAGGMALLSETCCDDLYEFTFSEFIKIEFLAEVKNVENESLDDFKLNVYLNNPNTGEKVLIKKEDLHQSSFELNLNQGYTYSIEISKVGYYSKNTEITTATISESIAINKDIILEKIPEEPIILKGILYEYNSAQLSKSAKAIIDTTLYQLLLDKENIVIQISSHTDNVGKDAYNMNLSVKRAKSVVNYLVDKGIDPMRLAYKGYGETMPIASNQNEDGSDNPTGRSLNRRTDFKVISELKRNLPEQEEDEEAKDKKYKREKKINF
ncbi:hypothetical protein DNU06_08805 [Putridiphycobacter roseus]|uniref:OmpA-like domain-containing protein n=1 Tax=Putridiphycobacter roseus TaxID=2219161 RepID=A0A2W1N1D2_9FLAO|nr:OmpA family protein [Putridiphycobacter roseus]PZE17360.1 hypothetical protein DNU06_08805 [Putridiphycobacter roseus]